jgi:hypothetical protein
MNKSSFLRTRDSILTQSLQVSQNNNPYPYFENYDSQSLLAQLKALLNCNAYYKLCVHLFAEYIIIMKAKRRLKIRSNVSVIIVKSHHELLATFISTHENLVVFVLT